MGIIIKHKIKDSNIFINHCSERLFKQTLGNFANRSGLIFVVVGRCMNFHWL